MLPADEDAWRMFNRFLWNGIQVVLLSFIHVSSPNVIWGMKIALNNLEQYGALKLSTDRRRDNIVYGWLAIP